jgi:hypothetical protein
VATDRAERCGPWRKRIGTIGIPERVVEKAVDPLDCCLVGRLPVPVVLPAVRGEDQPHLECSWTSRSPVCGGQALQKALDIRWNPEQVRRLRERVVVGAGQQDGVATLRGDLDWLAVVVHLLNEREQVLSSFARSDGHWLLLATLEHLVPVSDHKGITRTDKRNPRASGSAPKASDGKSGGPVREDFSVGVEYIPFAS